MTRRRIPVLAALITGLVTVSPVWIDAIDERTAIRWTLFIVMLVFLVLAGTFGWMLYRMVRR
jgi:heme/copper-type cytochrome/quinol oxidase subunit 2